MLSAWLTCQFTVRSRHVVSTYSWCYLMSLKFWQTTKTADLRNLQAVALCVITPLYESLQSLLYVNSMSLIFTHFLKCFLTPYSCFTHVIIGL